MGIREACIPSFLFEDLQAQGQDVRIALARYFEIPLDAWMASWFDERRWIWHFRFSHASWPDRGNNPPEEIWDYGFEHAHLMELGCRVPLSDFACEHGRRFRPERG